MLVRNSRRERIFEDCSAFQHLMNSAMGGRAPSCPTGLSGAHANRPPVVRPAIQVFARAMSQLGSKTAVGRLANLLRNPTSDLPASTDGGRSARLVPFRARSRSGLPVNDRVLVGQLRGVSISELGCHFVQPSLVRSIDQASTSTFRVRPSRFPRYAHPAGVDCHIEWASWRGG